jgi:hypothetical protein
VTNRIDELNPRALWYLQNFDEIDLADICASQEAAAERVAVTVARVQNLRDKWLDYPADDVHYAAGLTLARHLSGEACGSDQPQPAAHDGGPSVAEAAAHDRAWFGGEKAGE